MCLTKKTHKHTLITGIMCTGKITVVGAAAHTQHGPVIRSMQFNYCLHPLVTWKAWSNMSLAAAMRHNQIIIAEMTRFGCCFARGAASVGRDETEQRHWTVKPLPTRHACETLAETTLSLLSCPGGKIMSPYDENYTSIDPR